MGKLMDFVSRKAYEKAKKNVFKNIYKNLKCDGNFNIFYKCYEKTKWTKYWDKKQEFKEIYGKLINGSKEQLLREKERMNIEVNSISFPYTSMIIGLIIGVFPNIVVGINGILLPDNEPMKGLYNVLIVIYLSTILFSYSYLILVFDKEAFISTICLNALEEIELKLKENKEDSKNRNDDEVVEKIATTVEVHENSYKEKRKLKKEMKRQNKLKDDFSKLKLLDKDALLIRRYDYIEQAKIQRDNAIVVKEWMKIATILISILGIAVTIAIEGYEELILRCTLGSTLLILTISIFISGHNDKASHYETLVQYIDNELLKNKIE